MLPYKRNQRVGDLIRTEVSGIILTRLKDPRIGFVTVTEVQLTEDLKSARIYVSVLRKEQEDATLGALRKASGFIRREAAKNVHLKYMPDLEFYVDNSIDYGARIDTILKQIKGEDK